MLVSAPTSLGKTTIKEIEYLKEIIQFLRNKEK
jgi:hypothetical protein